MLKNDKEIGNNVLKILIVHHTMPDIPGFTTKMFDGVLPILKKYVNTKATWVIHSEPNLVTKSEPDEKIINMSNFKNAVEIINQEKPDLVYAIPGISIPDYAFALAAKYLKIPVIGSEMDSNFLFIKNMRGMISTSNKLRQFDIAKKSNQFFKKHLFLIKTQLALRWNIFQIMKEIIFFAAVYFPIIYKNPDFMPKFELDRIFVLSNKTMQKLVTSGFNESNLVITGDPTYDEYFQLLKTSKKRNTPKNKKNILILTTILFGESRRNILSQRRFFIEEIIKAIPRNQFEVTIKIHPTHEDLKDYTNIVEPINSSVNVTQNANLVELILNADIIITPVTGTSAICSLIARKPIIIWNVFNVESDALIQNKLALPCKDQKMILEQIRKAETWLPNEEKIEQFTREYLHASDGKASERTAVEIVNFLKRHKPHLF